MNLTNEQIREFFENPEKLKENFPDAFKSGIELGKWHWIDDGTTRDLINVNSTTNKNKNYGFGFMARFWTDFYGCEEFWSRGEYTTTLATPQEVEEALIKEAKLRGFKEGVKLISAFSGDKFKLSSNKLKYHSGVRFENYLSGIDCDFYPVIFEDGKWSEIIEEPKTNPMSFEPLESKVLQWAKDKGILDKATTMTQALKTLEEVNELLLAINSNNKGEIEDALGDILVTIIIGAELNGLKLTDCLQSAYLEIKDRKGKMVNGTFVKE